MCGAAEDPKHIVAGCEPSSLIQYLLSIGVVYRYRATERGCSSSTVFTYR